MILAILEKGKKNMMELGICYKYKTLKLHRGLWKRLQLTQPVRATEESAGKKKKKKKDYVVWSNYSMGAFYICILIF